MPGRDGTGPMGYGAATGRGLGLCTGNTAGSGSGLRLGYGRGRGCGLGMRCRTQRLPQESRELLLAQKENLQNRIKVIDSQLEDM